MTPNVLRNEIGLNIVFNLGDKVRFNSVCGDCIKGTIVDMTVRDYIIECGTERYWRARESVERDDEVVQLVESIQRLLNELMDIL